MVSAETRLQELGVQLPEPPRPLGAYVEVVQTGRLLFLSGMLPLVNGKPIYAGRIGDGLDAAAGREAARLAALNGLAVAKQYLGSLDRVTRVVRLGIYIATPDGRFDQPGVADGASELFRDVFGVEKLSPRIVFGVTALPVDMPIELEIILEVSD
jgi:enamine deaminase RidA (YjgF/YER057c/UK114 family)